MDKYGRFGSFIDFSLRVSIFLNDMAIDNEDMIRACKNQFKGNKFLKRGIHIKNTGG